MPAYQLLITFTFPKNLISLECSKLKKTLNITFIKNFMKSENWLKVSILLYLSCKRSTVNIINKAFQS